MDTNDLVTQVRARFDHESQKRLLQEKYEAKMLFAHAGGLWRAGPDLIVTLMCCSEAQSVLLDLYHTPIRIDTQELLALTRQRWQEQMTAWLCDWDQLSKNR